MTSYTTIPDSSVDQDSAITQPLMTALRDNPVAIAENDASVPLNLRSTVFLGTLTTTSGATQTLSGLDLTSFNRLRLIINGVSLTISDFFYVGASNLVRSVALSSVGDVIHGLGDIDLVTGVGSIMTSRNSNPQGSANGCGASGITTASTSIVVTANSGAFDAGSIRVYGHK